MSVFGPTKKLFLNEQAVYSFLLSCFFDKTEKFDEAAKRAIVQSKQLFNLDFSKEISTPYGGKSTLLEFAIFHQEIDAVEFLCNCGANVNLYSRDIYRYRKPTGLLQEMIDELNRYLWTIDNSNADLMTLLPAFLSEVDYKTKAENLIKIIESVIEKTVNITMLTNLDFSSVNHTNKTLQQNPGAFFESVRSKRVRELHSPAPVMFSQPVGYDKPLPTIVPAFLSSASSGQTVDRQFGFPQFESLPRTGRLQPR